MGLTLVLVFVGIILGTATLGLGGWFAGGVIGFLVGRVINLSDRVKLLRRDLDALNNQLPLQGDKAPPEVAATHTIEVPRALTTPNHDVPAKPHVPKASASAPSHTAAASAKPPISPSRPQPYHLAHPNLIDKALAAVIGFFTGGNPIVRVGMVVMFFGLSFLVKYAAGEGLFPLELRLATVALVAIALLILGWKTRDREGGYGQVLQGGGIAALYLTVFAALKLYQLLPAAVALPIMLLVVVLGVLLALLQNAQVLALMASAGGFLAPILTSDGSGSHVALFSFYLILNLGILAVAWFKAWRLLNWVGFVFTFVITTAWGVLSYRPEFYGSTQPFLIAFYALYLAVSVLFSLKQPPKLAALVDGSLVFGLPIVGFGLQARLLQHTEYGLSISALVLAAVYLLLARVLWTRYRETHRLLIESFIALGVGFATLAIPLALDARWTSAAWALEAMGLLWVGLRQQRWLPRIAAYLLHLAAAASLLLQWAEHGLRSGPWPLISGDFISLVILAGTALAMAWLLARFRDKAAKEAQRLESAAMFIGWCWWLVAGYLELANFVRGDYLFAGYAVFISLTTFALVWHSPRLKWPLLANTGFWLLPLMALWLLFSLGAAKVLGHSFHPSGNLGWLGIAAFVGCHYWALWRLRDHPKPMLGNAWHLAGGWFLWGLLVLEVFWWQRQLGDFWQNLGPGWGQTGKTLLWFLAIGAPLMLLMALINRARWPFDQFVTSYRVWLPGPLLFALAIWFIETSTYGGPASLYVPLLNPLDLAQCAAIVVLGYAITRNLCDLGSTPLHMRYGLLVGTGFIWLNLVVLRAVHHFAPVAYSADALWASDVVQMALSILWSLCALAVMRVARFRQDRQLWFTGVSLLGLVVLKLFTRDLSGTGTLAQVISFMAVGGLMLLIGYLSPIPKKTDETTKATNEEC